MDYLIWNYIEQTIDCLHCGGRYDFKSLLHRDVDLVDELSKYNRGKHRQCRKPNKKGLALQAYNDWYFDESEVTFDASLDHLYKFVKLRFVHLSYESFLEQYERSSYTIDFSYYHRKMEVHKLYPKWRYYIFRQMWKPDTREDLIKALKSVGAKIVSKEDVGPMPTSDYNFHSPRVEYREAERIWG